VGARRPFRRGEPLDKSSEVADFDRTKSPSVGEASLARQFAEQLPLCVAAFDDRRPARITLPSKPADRR
jgi:hypothetical protein